jgi:acetyl-CoA carboxylase biotin carboxyl carrier protein
MMDLGRVKELIDLFADADLAELDLREGDCQLRLARRTRTADTGMKGGCQPGESETPPMPASTAAEAAESADSQARINAKEVVAPMHGMLHLAPTPGAPPFVNIGESVRCGQTLAVLEAMKVFTALRSDVDGLVAAILAASGSEVAAGQPLFRIT